MSKRYDDIVYHIKLINPHLIFSATKNFDMSGKTGNQYRYHWWKMPIDFTTNLKDSGCKPATCFHLIDLLGVFARENSPEITKNQVFFRRFFHAKNREVFKILQSLQGMHIIIRGVDKNKNKNREILDLEIILDDINQTDKKIDENKPALGPPIGAAPSMLEKKILGWAEISDDVTGEKLVNQERLTELRKMVGTNSIPKT